MQQTHEVDQFDAWQAAQGMPATVFIDGDEVVLPADPEARRTMLGIWLTVDAPDPDDEDLCENAR